MFELREDVLDVDTYLMLRDTVGWKKLTYEQAEQALENSIKTLVAYEDGRPVGMGRIVGDGVVICYIQDLVVSPKSQGNCVGGEILERLIAYVKNITLEGTEMMLCLMCAKGRENFYSHHNFIARPTDSLGPGMIQYISKK